MDIELNNQLQKRYTIHLFKKLKFKPIIVEIYSIMKLNKQFND